MGLDLPLPSDLSEVARVEHTRLRRRLTNGEGLPDFQAQLVKNMGGVRAAAIGEPDASLNPLDDNCAAAAALYDLHPALSHPDAPSLGAMVRLVDDALLYPLMGRVQKDTLVAREELLRVDVRQQGGRPVASYRPVYADMVELRAGPQNPGQPIELFEWVERNSPTGVGTIWTRESWSIDGVPTHRVLSQDGATDLSKFYGLPEGGARGEQYPAIRSDGRPILPYVLFHAAITGHLLDPYYKRELVLGTLNVVVAWTYFGHVLRRGSNGQRWIAGGTIAGAVGRDGRVEATGDPAVVVEILKDPQSDGQLLVGQWGAPVDPLAFAKAIGVYQERFNNYLGVEFRRNNDATDPRSGLAIVADTAGRRSAQRKFSPTFKPADEQVLSVTATLANRAMGGTYFVEDGWQVEHVGLPPSPEERDGERREILELLDKRLITRAEARRRLTGETPEQTAAALAVVDAEGTKASPFAQVGLPALVSGGIIGAAAARKMLGVGEESAPTPDELAALRGPAPTP